MKRILTLLALALLIAAPMSQAQDAAPEANPDHPDKIQYPELTYAPPQMKDYRHELSNGIVVYIAEDHEAPIVEMSVTVNTGSTWEPAEKIGLASITGAQMRSGGTERMTPQELDERLNFLAATISTSIGAETGTASMWTLSKDLDETLGLFRDVLKTPRFDQAKFDLAKESILTDLAGRNDSSRAVSGREWSVLMYGDHPMNRFYTRASIESITREDMVAFHQQYFFPSNMMVAINGAFDTKEMLAKLETFFADWEDRERLDLQVPDAPHVPAPGVYVVDKPEVNQASVTIGHRGIKIGDPDRWALQLGNFVLGGGSFTSRLNQKVRSDEGLAYSVGSGVGIGMHYTDVFRMAYQTKNSTVGYAAELCNAELKRLIDEGITEEELQAAKNYYIESFPRRWSNKNAIVNSLLYQEHAGLGEDYWNTYRENLAAVTVDQIQDALSRRLKSGDFVYLVVGNLETVLKGSDRSAVSLFDFGTVKQIPLRNVDTMEYEGSVSELSKDESN
jgi:predicted Zn-dependent peptidase